MKVRHLIVAGAVGLAMAAPAAAQGIELASGKISLTGTTNVHGYTAETTRVTLANVQLGAFDGDPWSLVQQPSAVTALDVVIPSASLKSTKDGIDKNMHKALNVSAHPNIVFHISRLEAREAPGALRAHGTLTVNGVTKEIAVDLTAAKKGANVAITGEYTLLMTDYGVKPPKAMMGMMKTDPKIVLAIDLLLS